MKKLYKIWILPVFLLCFAGCDLVGNIDDIKPHYQQTLENVVRDSASAYGLVQDVYRCWRNGNILESMVNMSFLSGSLSTSEANITTNSNNFMQNNVTSNLSSINALYLALYKVINEANVAISLLEDNNAQGLSEAGKEAMIGECRFHRALADFYLLRHFGQFWDTTSMYGVVVRTKPYVDNSEAAPRATVKEVYTAILSDLDYAIEKGPERVPSGQHYYISRMTAKALKAKVLLNMGNYRSAEIVAREVIDNAASLGYELEEEDFQDIFVNGYRSKEVLFALYSFGSTESFNVSSLQRTTYGKYTLTIAEDPTWEDYYPGIPRDIDMGLGYEYRFCYVYKQEGPDIGGGSGSEPQQPDPEPLPDDGGEPLPDDGGGILSDDGGGILPDDGGGVLPDDPSDPTQPVSRERNHKYPYESYNNPGQGNTYFFLRLAEVYYIHAEAAARNNNFDGAFNSMNEVLSYTRSFHMLEYEDPIPDSEMLEFVRKHKWIELFGENNEEWFDLIRYYYKNNLTMSELTAIKSTLKNEKQFILPIPQSALAGNNLLVQNP